MWLVYDRGINLLDEGFTVHASERVADGQIPYRDFFTLLTPGSFVVHGLLFNVFGKSLLVGRWLAFLLGTLIPVLVYRLARRLAAPWFACAAALVSIAWGVSESIWPVYANYAWFACAFVLASCDFACKGQDDLGAGRTGRGNFAAAGAFAGLAFAFKQNTGLYALVGLVACLAFVRGWTWRQRAVTAALACGAAAWVNVPWLVWIAIGGGWDAMVADLLLIPLRSFRTDASAPYPLAWPLWPSVGGPGVPTWSDALVIAGRRVIAWAPLLYVGSALALARRLHRSGMTTAYTHATVLVFGGATFLTIFPRADLLHVLFALPIGFSLAAPLLEAAWRSPPDGSRRMLTWSLRGATAFVVVLLLAGQVADAARVHAGESRLDRPRAGVRVTPEQRAPVEAVLGEIEARTQTDDPILVVPWAAMFYFLGPRRNPTAFDLLIVANLDEAGETRLLQQLEAAPPRLVVRGHEWDVDGKSLEVCAPRVAAWIAARYRSVGRRAKYEFFEPVR
jgi:hypothetical protein